MADGSTTAQVHPEKLTKALMAAAEERGAILRIGTVEGLCCSEEGRVTGGSHFQYISIAAPMGY